MIYHISGKISNFFYYTKNLFVTFNVTCYVLQLHQLYFIVIHRSNLTNFMTNMCILNFDVNWFWSCYLNKILQLGSGLNLYMYKKSDVAEFSRCQCRH
jgi:hypothetical protein